MRFPLARIAATACAVLLTCAASAASAQGGDAERSGVVNINTANAEQLELLPGIGPARAAAIIVHRKEHGAFKRVDDLIDVSGIGEPTLARLRPHCVVQGRTTRGP